MGYFTEFELWHKPFHLALSAYVQQAGSKLVRAHTGAVRFRLCLYEYS